MDRAADAIPEINAAKAWVEGAANTVATAASDAWTATKNFIG